MKILSIIFFLILCAITATAQTPEQARLDDLGKSLIVVTRKPLQPANPIDALRTGKLIYVKSSSVFVGASVVEEKLQKRREFQSLGLMVTRDEEAADIVLELRHDVFTKYVYSAVDPKTKVVIASGKLSSLGGTVAGKVAERFLKQLLRARQ
jgi:hypothetical protein